MAAASRITVVAGTGTQVFAGEGSRATSALLTTSYEAVADQRGNVYIADLDNHRIRKVDWCGIITTIAGTGQPGFSGDGGPAVNALLNGPHLRKSVAPVPHLGSRKTKWDSVRDWYKDRWSGSLRQQGWITAMATGEGGFEVESGCLPSAPRLRFPSPAHRLRPR